MLSPRASRTSDPRDPGDSAAVLLLAAVAGCVDAIAFVESGGFFLSFMSGNSTQLGIAIGEHDWPLAGFAFGLVALFVGGVAAGRLIGDRFGARRACVLLVAEALLLGIAAWLYGNGGQHQAPPFMAVAMGLANTVLARDGEAAPAVTYMTGALVRVGEGLARGGGGIALDLLLWLAFVTGGVIGAIGDLADGGAMLRWPAAVLLLLAAWRWYRD